MPKPRLIKQQVDDERWIDRYPGQTIVGAVIGASIIAIAAYISWKFFVWLVHVAMRS